MDIVCYGVPLGRHFIKFPNFVETLGNESSCEDKLWLAGPGDNGLCIIQVKICLPGRNMPPREKYACLKKVQKGFFVQIQAGE